jgi:hypothetical protein
VIVVLGLIIAILANVCCNKTKRRHEGAIWDRVAAKEDDDDDGIAEDSPNIERGASGVNPVAKVTWTTTSTWRDGRWQPCMNASVDRRFQNSWEH